MKPFRSVGFRLSLALALVVAIALAVVWAIVTPTLADNLTRTKADQLALRGAALADQVPPYGIFRQRLWGAYQQYADDTAAATNARVVVYEVRRRRPERVLGYSPQTVPPDEVIEDEVALRTARLGTQTEGIVTRGEQEYVEVAFPIEGVPLLVLFSSSLEDTQSTVRAVKRRLLAAGGIALGLAFLLGYGGASVFARRIRRLERAADRIAGGQFDEPVEVEGSDELGQLAEAFERMRVRLAQLDNARREFIANASHELRTPIFSLGGFLELMANEELDEETRREFLGTMQEQVRRLEKLATDLLDLTRLDAGQLRLEIERLDLQDVAESLAEEFAGLARATEHAVEVERNGAAPEVLADETRTLQIGRVLVENAIRHTPPGTRVRIGADRVGGRAVLRVEDDGPGIPASHAGQVFDRFFRMEGAQASGSGLGLAIARQLAAAMGGTVEVESRPRRTVFRLELPAAARMREPAVS